MRRAHATADALTVNGSLLAVAFLLATTLLATPSVSSALPLAPHWVAISQPAPSDFHPGDSSDFYEIFVLNDGTAASSEPATLTDTLPAGVVVNTVNGMECEQAVAGGVTTLTCTIAGGVAIGQVISLNINIHVSGGASGSLVNAVTISGGGAPGADASTATPVTPSSEEVPFGASLASDITETGGVATQAGSHPFVFATMLAFNVGAVNPNEHCSGSPCAVPNTQAKDIEVALPPGLVGNPTAMPQCTQGQFERHSASGCPVSTQVGFIYLYFYGEGTAVQYAPVYNLKPSPGEPGALGFSVSTLAHIAMHFRVRSDGDYGLTAYISDINQFDAVRAAVLSIWGDPADPAHDPLRESEEGNCTVAIGGCPSGILAPKPFLRLPTSCTSGPLSIPLRGDSWQQAPEETSPFAVLSSSNIVAMTGCEALRFEPSIAVESSTHKAGAPAGYEVVLKVPQSEELEAVGTADVRDVEVTLPEGTTISPSSANGLLACSEEQFGLKVRAKGSCPSASKIGTVKITTPLLGNPITGTLYVGAPECSPCSPAQAGAGQMVHLLLEAEGAGVIVKLSGHTEVDQSTGQLKTVFTENPQLPINELQVSLEQGPSAPLVNPSTCGEAITVASITPWSSMTARNVSAPVSVEGCGSPGFAPRFQAGSTSSPRAEAFTGFEVSMSRNDGEQELERVSVTTPPGLLGVLKSVEQCPEPAASTGSCSAGSLIGSGSIALGPGSDPLTIGGSRVYLTGPYAGKPFGLSIVTPAQAGPFVLAGNTGTGNEVVRASIAVDPSTSALTVTSDPLPQALNGISLDIRTIDIDIDRPGFIFSPTNCDAMSVTGAIVSTKGAIAGVSYPFQAVDCAVLAFKPRFTAATQAKTSKRDGASLHVHVTSGAGQANIAKVKTDLPIQLPSRNSTLQKACVDRVFDANPASCSAESIVGHASAVTPLLKNPLTGPAYLVSHAGLAFPDLEIVLQSEGITLTLDGNTHIKHGVTSSTFKALPDAPIDSFDLVLPEGPHSILAAFGSLCTSRLKMPTVITGQNGAVVKQTTKIATSGCPKHKVSKRRHAKSG